MYLSQFGEGIISFADYERNSLMLAPYYDAIIQAHALMLKYNSDLRVQKLLTACGCDPCHETMINFHIYSLRDQIILNCNNYGYLQVTKVNIQDRSKVDMQGAMKTITDVKNRIFIAVLPKKRGCLYSFYHNNLPVSFLIALSEFMAHCPRQCPSGICNKGQCRLLDLSGPLCDCSSTAFNRPHCDNRLKEYRRENNNSYGIMRSIREAYIKLSWKRLVDKKYCLLQMITEHIHVTFSIYGSNIMRDQITLATINSDIANFLSLRWSTNNMEIKVNNIMVHSNRFNMDGSQINVGYSNVEGECESFEGSYDFIASGFKIIQSAVIMSPRIILASTARYRSLIKKVQSQSTVNTTIPQVVRTHIIIDSNSLIGISIFALIVAVAIILVIVIRKILARNVEPHGMVGLRFPEFHGGG